MKKLLILILICVVGGAGYVYYSRYTHNVTIQKQELASSNVMNTTFRHFVTTWDIAEAQNLFAAGTNLTDIANALVYVESKLGKCSLVSESTCISAARVSTNPAVTCSFALSCEQAHINGTAVFVPAQGEMKLLQFDLPLEKL